MDRKTENTSAKTAAEADGQAESKARPPASVREIDPQHPRLVYLEARDGVLAAIENSTFWRLTRPLARALARHHALRRALRALAGLALGKSLPPAPAPVPAVLEASVAMELAQPAKPDPRGKPLLSPAAAEQVAAVPFGHAAVPPGAPSLAVICHIYYVELAEEIRAYLDNIPFGYDLHVSTDTEAKRRALERIIVPGGHMRTAQLQVAPNRGRDVAPKLICWPEAYRTHEYVLHLHTKRSLHADAMVGWRGYLFDALLGSPQVVASVFEAFAADPALGMVAPDHYRGLSPFLGWGFNFERALRLGERMGMKLRPDGLLDFPSGSMFWARSKALAPLLDLGLAWEDFDAEAGQTDGTTAHAIERLYFLACERAGCAWMKVAPRELAGQQSGIINYIESAEDLRDFTQRHRVWLSAPAQVDTAQGGTAAAEPRAQLAAPVEMLEDADPVLRTAWLRSDRRDLGYTRFAAAVESVHRGEPGEIDFDEAFYLAMNPDVARAVAAGTLPGGYAHFCLQGRADGRAWSDGQLAARFGLAPASGEGMMHPVRARPLPRKSRIFTAQAGGARPFLLVMVWYLQEDLFFAGLNALFADLKDAFGRYERIMVSVEAPSFEPELARRYSPHIEVVPASTLATLDEAPSVVVTTNHELTQAAIQRFGGPARVVYYCQEFESGFYPYSANFVQAENAIAQVPWLVVSTRPLERFLRERGLIRGQRVCLVAPNIRPVAVDAQQRRRIFCYYRPESFQSRNLPETVIDAVERLCRRRQGYEFYLMGTVATRYSYTLNGNRVFVLSKLPVEEYEAILGSCDAAVALIYSAHPGVIAFQAAASGIPTVTNVFDNRDAAWLTAVSENLLPYDPVRDDLADKIDEALARPKGKPSFDAGLYADPAAPSLADFLDEVRGIAPRPA